jgi:hypothetical protein
MPATGDYRSSPLVPDPLRLFEHHRPETTGYTARRRCLGEWAYVSHSRCRPDFLKDASTLHS